ncbi:MAG TPA: ImmA/IrrE family metallo-endopeptidase [Lacipirellulaceae bacterium]|jgi:Zn-dependent peptidase ImmA (M78 family)
MLPEIPTEEFAAAVDDCAADTLWEAGITEPPIDATLIAERIGLVVASDETMSVRGRFVRLADAAGRDTEHGTIVVGPAERPERMQWAVAHEIGESVAYRVFATLGVQPEVAPSSAREIVANHLASCLLLPRPWFAAAGRELDWDLFGLKQRFATASHELIARRMLEMRPPIVITMCDQGSIRWRRSNAAGRPPKMFPREHSAWQRCHERNVPTSATLDPAETGLELVRAWPIHEPDWKREILRSEVAEC